jgi:hypothetical protein
MITGLHGGHLTPDLLNDPGRLMTKNTRESNG